MLEYLVILLLSASTIVFLILFIRKDRAHRNLLKKNLQQQQFFSVLMDDIVYEQHTKDDNEQKILVELQRQMEQEKVYLDKNLTIASLAAKMGTNRTILSKVINKSTRHNFPSLINYYRVQEAVRMLKEEQNNQYTLEYISDKCGYANRQVFHASFKQGVGMTPNRFKKFITNTQMQSKELHSQKLNEKKD